MARSSEFKSRILAQKTIWAAGAYDALSAKLIGEAGFDADKFFGTTAFSGSHENSVIALLNGTFAGAAT